MRSSRPAVWLALILSVLAGCAPARARTGILRDSAGVTIV